MTTNDESPLWNLAQGYVTKAKATPGFKDSHRSQVEVLHDLTLMPYKDLLRSHQQFVLAGLVDLIPRFDDMPKAIATLDSILRLDSFEDVSRALKVRPQLVDFPMEAEESIYPTDGWIGDFIFWARQSKCPFGFLFWAGVAAISASCRFNYFFDWGVKNIRLNEYTILVGDKATGKSLAKDAAVELMRRANKLLTEDAKIRLLPEDTTVENLIKVMTFKDVTDTDGDKVESHGLDSTGILVLDEIATFLGKKVHNLEKRVPFITTLYGRDEYDEGTKGDGAHTLKNAAFSILACGAPEWLKNSLTPDLFNKGFMDRTLFIHRDPVRCRGYPIPMPQDPVMAVSLAKQLAEFAHRQSRVEMMATAHGMRWYEDWYNKKNGKSVELWGHHRTSVDRQAIHLWKLASILTISNREMPWISEARFEEAAKYMSLERSHFMRCMEIVELAPEVELEDYLMSVVKRLAGEDGWVARGALLAAIRGKKALRSAGNKKTLALLEDLRQAGFLESRQEGRVVWYRLTGKGE